MRIRRTFLGIGGVAAAGLILGAFGSLSAQTVSGSVIDARSGIALSGVLVRTSTADGALGDPFFSGVDGRFSVPFGPGFTSVHFSVYGYARLAVPHEAIPSSGMMGVIPLEPTPITIEGITVEAPAQCEVDETRAEATRVLESARSIWAEVGANNRLATKAYVLQLVRPVKVWRNQNWHYQADTSIAVWDAVIPQATLEEYRDQGFAVAESDSVNSYRAPSPDYFASAYFGDNYCFTSESRPEGFRVHFEPKRVRGEVVDISGVLDFTSDYRPSRATWSFENVGPFVERHHIPLFEAAIAAKKSEYEQIIVHAAIDEGNTGGLIVFDDVESIGLMTTAWEIRAVMLGERSIGLADPSGGRVRHTTFTVDPFTQALATSARLVALREWPAPVLGTRVYESLNTCPPNHLGVRSCPATRGSRTSSLRQRSELRRRQIAQRAVGPVYIVEHSVLFGQDLRLGQAGEDLLIQELVAQPAVERLDVCVLPRATRFDEERLHA